MIFSCTSNKGVYWCGDHPCVNKKEREAYFKKTMVVEIREIKKGELKKNSQIEEIKLQAKFDENRRIKDEKKMVKQLELEEKNRIQEEKALAQQLESEEKNRIKEEKSLAQKLELEEKNMIKEEKALAKQLELDEKIQNKKNVTEIKKNLTVKKVELSKFRELVDKIIIKNSLKSYPDINDIPIYYEN